MAVNLQYLPVSTLAILQKMSDTGHSCRARTCLFGNLTVAPSFAEKPCHFEAFTPCLELAQGPYIAEEVL